MRFASQIDIRCCRKSNHLSNMYFTIPQNSAAPWIIHLQFKIRSIILIKKHNVHEMPAVIQFPSIHCELPSSFLRENLNSDCSSSSAASQTHYSKNSDQIYSDQEISILGQSQFSHDSPSKQQEQQSPASNQSLLSPRASRQSSPALHPFGLEDYQ